ncbi:protein sidekick-1 isoform X2 [Mastacembelus armatus]|uniref:protein sidekick-1 isoform X2 n=1 Tax=Mastacembelus armatus TaxID=205130 RepID=UPI000E45A08D|nr:protein sidekick-1-like isoform X2 [Mastacembelus armatus]
MVGCGFHLKFLDSKCYCSTSQSCYLVLASPGTADRVPSPVSCRSITSLQHCRVHPDGVHDLDCFGKYNNRGTKLCVWKPGNHAQERTYTLLIKQKEKKCRAYINLPGLSKVINLHENYNLTAEVYENTDTINCTKAVFSALPKNLLRCGPPHKLSVTRNSGKLDLNVSWEKEDMPVVTLYSVRYRALSSLSWNRSLVRSQNENRCTVENLNSSLVYVVQIQCVANDKCTQCPWSETYTIPSELTAQPVIVKFEDTAMENGRRLLTLSWKFSAHQQLDGYYVTIGKESEEDSSERMYITQPQLTLVLSYSAYYLNVSAVNNVSISPAVSRTIPQKQDMPDVGLGKLNVTVHNNMSFSIYWKNELSKTFVCFSVEWRRSGHKTLHMSFHENANYRTLSSLPEALEPYSRYSITLHARPKKPPCNMKHINNSESTYGSTQFYFIEGTPVSAPTNISSYNVTQKSVVLQWLSIPEEDIRGFLLGYTIHYREFNWGTEKNVTVDPLSNYCELGDLTSGTAYQVQISGFTEAGAGVRSAPSFFKTDQEYFNINVSGVVIILAVVVTLLIFGPSVIKRTKVIVWPSIPHPGKSYTMQKIEGPCELELLESINTLKVEEWDTNSLQIVEKEAATPAGTLPSTLQLLNASEDESYAPDMTCDWSQGEPEDAASDILPDDSTDTCPNIQQKNPPLAFSTDYTTMEMFHQGISQVIPANTVTQATDLTVAKSELDYVGQFSTSPISDSEDMLKVL